MGGKLAKTPTSFATNSSEICSVAGPQECAKASACLDALVDTVAQGLEVGAAEDWQLEFVRRRSPTAETPRECSEETSGAVLNLQKVEGAREAEVEHMHKMSVHTESSMAECLAAGHVSQQS